MYKYFSYFCRDVFKVVCCIIVVCEKGLTLKSCRNYKCPIFSGGRRTEGLKAADIVPMLRERVSYLSGIVVVSSPQIVVNCKIWK